MVRKLQSFEFAIVAGFALYVGVTAWFWPRMDFVAQASQQGPARNGPSWQFTNPEVEQLVLELKDEKAALAERRAELDELAARLQAEQMELSVVTQKVHQLQKELDETIVRMREDEAGNLKKLARIYSAMSPEGAAAILKQLEEATIVKVLTLMKEDQSGPILEILAGQGEVESKLAASVCERLRLAVSAKPSVKPRS